MTWEPPEPETLYETVLMMHEYYRELVRQGFTKHEALHIVGGQPCCQRKDLDS